MSGTLLTEGIQGGAAPSGSPALGGLRVLEISASDSFAASLLAMLLADQGAAVVKVGLDHAHAPVEDERARTTSREARARAGIDRNKNVLEPLASASEIDRLAALADVVILPYDTGIVMLGSTIGRPFSSIRSAQVCFANGLADRNSPVSRSST